MAEPDLWGNFSFVPNLRIWVPNGPSRIIGSLILAASEHGLSDSLLKNASCEGSRDSSSLAKLSMWS